MNDMQTVYRVENERGEGPYNQIGVTGIHGESYDERRCPPPYKDGMGKYWGDKDKQFGFASLAHMHAWFNGEERTFLTERGYCVSVYSVHRDYVTRGHKQVAFNRSAAVCELTLSLI